MGKRSQLEQECFRRSIAINKELKRVNYYIGGQRYDDAMKVLDYLINTYKLDKLRKRVKLLNDKKEGEPNATTSQSNSESPQGNDSTGDKKEQ